MMDYSNSGRRVRLIHTNDQFTNLKPGDEGTYRCENQLAYTGTQHMIDWDNGSTLMLVDEDRWEFI